jgi:hypothetical protein
MQHKKEELIEHLEATKREYICNGFDKEEPDLYENLLKQLEALKNGAEFKTYDLTKELKTAIAFLGGQMPTIQMRYKNKQFNPGRGITWEKAREIAKEFEV